MKRIVGNGGSGGSSRMGTASQRTRMLRAAGITGAAASARGSRRAGNLQAGSRALRGAAAQARGGARARARRGG